MSEKCRLVVNQKELTYRKPATPFFVKSKNEKVERFLDLQERDNRIGELSSSGFRDISKRYALILCRNTKKYYIELYVISTRISNEVIVEILHDNPDEVCDLFYYGNPDEVDKHVDVLHSQGCTAYNRKEYHIFVNPHSELFFLSDHRKGVTDDGWANQFYKTLEGRDLAVEELVNVGFKQTFENPELGSPLSRAEADKLVNDHDMAFVSKSNMFEKFRVISKLGYSCDVIEFHTVAEMNEIIDCLVELGYDISETGIGGQETQMTVSWG